jgi:hypothetical protein
VNDSSRLLRRELDELRERTRGLPLRLAPGGAGNGGASSATACRLTASAHNLSGRDARPMEALYVERDDKPVAAVRGFYEEYYPTGGTAPQLIEYRSFNVVTPTATDYGAVHVAASLEPNDMIVVFAQNEWNNAFPFAAAGNRGRQLSERPFENVVAGYGQLQVRAIWGDQIGAAKVVLPESTNVFRRQYFYMVIRGVERRTPALSLVLNAGVYADVISQDYTGRDADGRTDGLWLAAYSNGSSPHDTSGPGNPFIGYQTAPAGSTIVDDLRTTLVVGDFTTYSQTLMVEFPGNSGPSTYNGARKFASFIFLPPADAEAPPGAPLPNDTCSLRVTGLPYSEPVRGKATDSARVAAAQAKLRKAWRRRIVIAQEPIAACGVGKVATAGLALAWVYVRNPEDAFAGPPPTNRWRTKALDFGGSPPGGPIEAYTGPYYEREANARVRIGGTELAPEYDPLLASFNGHPWCLYSGSAGVPILHRYRADAAPRLTSGEADTLLTVTATFTRTAGVVTITAVSISATAGGSTVTGIDGGTIAPGGLSASGDVSNPITIARDPLAFDDVPPTNGTNNRGSFSLACGRWTVRPLPSLTAAMTDGQSLTDSYTFQERLIDLTKFPGWAPFVYETPQTAPAGLDLADLAPWPQFPRAASDLGVQPYDEDGDVLTTHTVRAPEKFDPLLGRVPGSDITQPEIDRRIGLQLCLVDLSRQTFRSDDDCC